MGFDVRWNRSPANPKRIDEAFERRLRRCFLVAWLSLNSLWAILFAYMVGQTIDKWGILSVTIASVMFRWNPPYQFIIGSLVITAVLFALKACIPRPSKSR